MGGEVMNDYQAHITLIVLFCGISAFIGFALGEKNAGYSCSPAQAERIYLKGADALYEQLIEQGRLKE